jgi:MFS family permease
MFTSMKKATLATAMAASALASATPAMARDYHRHNGSNRAAIAVGAGIIGLAIGAIAASNSRDRRYDNRYYDSHQYYYRDGYYYDRDGRRYDRDHWQRGDRWDRDDYRRGYGRDYYYRRGY